MRLIRKTVGKKNSEEHNFLAEPLVNISFAKSFKKYIILKLKLNKNTNLYVI